MSLLQTDQRKNLPLHIAADRYIIQKFRTVLESFITRKRKGLISYSKIDNETPFQLACSRFIYKSVMRTIKEF